MNRYVLGLSLGSFIHGAAAGGGASFNSVYTSGDVILEHPIESSTIMLFVIGVSASLEYLLDTAGEVENKYFRVMFEALSEEITVVGLLSLILSFSESILADLPPRWLDIFNWAHMCLFFMAICLILIVGVLLVTVVSHGKKWMDFEVTRIHQAKGRKNYFKGKENQFYNAHCKFFECVTIAGYTEEQKEKILFSDYLLKAERACLVELTDLSWRSWMALTTMIIINALRTKFIPIKVYNELGEFSLEQNERLINFSTYVGFCGFLPLIGFLMINHRLNLRLEQYLAYDPLQKGAAPTNLRELYDPKAFLFWQSTEGTLTVLQIFIMFFEWYISVFCLSMLYEAMTKFDVFYRLLIILAFMPLVVFMYMMPWMLTVVALLSHLGSSLDKEIIEKILDSSKEYTTDGKHGDYIHKDNEEQEEELLPPDILLPGRGGKKEDEAVSRGVHQHPKKKFTSNAIEIDDGVMFRFTKQVQGKKALQDRKREKLEGKIRPATLLTSGGPSGYFSDDPTSPSFERGFGSIQQAPSPGPRNVYIPPSMSY